MRAILLIVSAVAALIGLWLLWTQSPWFHT
jgi:hypothetical protein